MIIRTCKYPEPYVEKAPPNRRVQAMITLGLLCWAPFIAALFLAGAMMGQAG